MGLAEQKEERDAEEERKAVDEEWLKVRGVKLHFPDSFTGVVPSDFLGKYTSNPVGGLVLNTTNPQARMMALLVDRDTSHVKRSMVGLWSRPVLLLEIFLL